MNFNTPLRDLKQISSSSAALQNFSSRSIRADEAFMTENTNVPPTSRLPREYRRFPPKITRRHTINQPPRRNQTTLNEIAVFQPVLGVPRVQTGFARFDPLLAASPLAVVVL